MNPFETQAQLVRELFELSTDTVRKVSELSAENFRKYLQLNQDYAQKLPEINDVNAFVELQREYGQNLWEGVQEDLSAGGSIVREAAEQTGGLIRNAFSAEDAEAEVETVKAKGPALAA